MQCWTWFVILLILFTTAIRVVGVLIRLIDTFTNAAIICVYLCLLAWCNTIHFLILACFCF